MMASRIKDVSRTKHIAQDKGYQVVQISRLTNDIRLAKV